MDIEILLRAERGPSRERGDRVWRRLDRRRRTTEYELSWVEATGELYLMVEPDARSAEDAFGDLLRRGRTGERAERS